MELAGPDRLCQVEAVIAALFPGDVAVAVTDPGLAKVAGLGAEGAHLTRALPKRQREFVAGRAAARAAQIKLGLTPQPVMASADRAPIWPAGVAGSISHSDTLCAAAVTQAPVHLGLDLELFTPLSAGLLDTICGSDEIARIAGPDQLRLAKLIFSAKEAAFKAQYPGSGTLFGFEVFDVTLDVPQSKFVAVFTRRVAGYEKGHKIKGRFASVTDHVVTAAVIPQSV